jgi:glucose-1-phosphatase
LRIKLECLKNEFRIKVILFDIGGVIVRTVDPAPRERLAHCFGLNRKGIDELVFLNPVAQAAERGEAVEEAVWEYVGKRLNLSALEMEDFQAAFWGGDCADVSLIELMAHLHRRYRTGLLTNSWLRDPLPLFWRRFDVPEVKIRSAVDLAVSSAELGVQKPEAQIFNAVLDRFQVRAAETVFVDDFSRNVDAARDLGFQGILFESPTQMRRDLLSLLER